MEIVLGSHAPLVSEALVVKRGGNGCRDLDLDDCAEGGLDLVGGAEGIVEESLAGEGLLEGRGTHDEEGFYPALASGSRGRASVFDLGLLELLEFAARVSVGACCSAAGAKCGMAAFCTATGAKCGMLVSKPHASGACAV